MISFLAIVTEIIFFVAAFTIFVIILSWVNNVKSRYDVLVLKRGFWAALVLIIALLIEFFILRSIIPSLSLKLSVIGGLILAGIFGGICLHGLQKLKTTKGV